MCHKNYHQNYFAKEEANEDEEASHIKDGAVGFETYLLNLIYQYCLILLVDDILHN